MHQKLLTLGKDIEALKIKKINEHTNISKLKLNIQYAQITLSFKDLLI